MSEEITALVPSSFEECDKIAKRLAPSKLLAGHLRNDEASVYLTILAGRELGIPPMASLRAFHLVEGVPRLSADAMRAIVRSSPLCEYLRAVDTTAVSCTWETKRRGEPAAARYTFTIEQAKRARLVKDGSNWDKYPERMLSARAVSFLLRDVYPELLAGLISSEEAADDSADATGMTPADKAGAIEAIAAAAPVRQPPSAQAAPPPLALTAAEEDVVSTILAALPDADHDELGRMHASLLEESAPVREAVEPHLYRTMIGAARDKRDLAWVAGRLKDRPALKELLRDDYATKAAALSTGVNTAAAAASGKDP